MSAAPRILMTAGDPSGDKLAAGLARALLNRLPEADLFGYGGPLMAAAGVRVEEDLVSLSAIGLLDALPKVPQAYGWLKALLAQCHQDPPDAAALVDCGAFNLPLAKGLQELGMPVLGYFPPGSWSGSRKRARKVAAHYTAVATPYPQPLPVYQELGLEAELVGHPLVRELAPLATPPGAPLPDPPVLAVLPGSRAQEIKHLLPPLLDAVRRLRERTPNLQVRLSRAPAAPRALFDRLLDASGVAVEVVEGARDAMVGATAGLIKSGTVTLEAALLGLPMVVVYRASHLAYLVGSLYYWPRPKFWAMPNLLAQDHLVPQLFQYRVYGEHLAREVAPLLGDTPERRAMVDGLRQATDPLRAGGGPPPAERTADLLLRLLDRQATRPG